MSLFPDNPYFDDEVFFRSQISIRWHGVIDVNLRHVPVSPPEPPFNCRCDPGGHVGKEQRIILVNGPLNGRRMVVSDDRDEWRFPYDPDPTQYLRYLRYEYDAPVVDGMSEYTQLRYRFENREGDVTDSGELVYRFQWMG